MAETNREDIRRGRIWFGVLAIIIASIGLFSFSTDRISYSIRAEKGRMDLSCRDFSDSFITSLDGEWESFPGELKNPDQLTGIKKPVYQNIPSAFSFGDFSLIYSRNPSFGQATYRLTVLIPKNSRQKALYVPGLNTASQVWVDGEKVLSLGTIGSSQKSSIPEVSSDIIYLPQGKDSCEIVCKISNYHYNWGGMLKSMAIGSAEAVNAYHTSKMQHTFFFFGIFFVFSLYHLTLYILRPKELLTLYFSLLCLFFALRFASINQSLMLSLFPGISFELQIKIQYIPYYAALPLAVLFLKSLFPSEISRKAVSISAGITGLFIASIVIFPARIYSFYTSQPFHLLSLLMVSYLLFAIILAAARREEGASAIAFGSIVATAMGINDVLYIQRIVHTGYMMDFGMLALSLTYAYTLSVKFSNAFHTVELMSDEISRKNESLLSLDKLKDEFLANTSHELKTPIHGIIGITDAIEAGSRGTLDKEIGRDIRLINKSGRRLAVLIDDILDFSRLKNGSLTLQLEKIEIEFIIQYAIASLEPLALKKGLTLISDIPEDLKLVLADENRLIQIILNLLGNAIKFTREGTVSICACESASLPGYTEIRISDTGIGIPSEQIEKIFNPFDQADGSISREFGGTGLGLAITKKLIELHDGKIKAWSVEGKGSIFTVYLHTADGTSGSGIIRKNDIVSPVFIDSGDSERIENPPAPSGIIQSHILIVDDDEINIHVLEQFLVSENFSVKVCSSGQDALALIAGGYLPSLILLDVMMPKMSGYECSEKIRQIFSLAELPIIMMTAKDAVRDIVAGFSSGANDYISKPFERAELLARVKTLLLAQDALNAKGKLLALQEQLNLARKIQLSTMPLSIPDFPGLSIATRYFPMESVGGDFYNFKVIDGDKFAVLVTDVSGHGIPAAIIASMVHIGFNSLSGNAEDPVEFLSKMRTLLANNIENQFVTASYCVIDRANERIQLARAGHEPLLVINKTTGNISSYLPKGTPLGFPGNRPFVLCEFPITAGDRIVIYTDGIIEAFSRQGEIFGMKRFEDILRSSRETSAEEVCSEIITALREWTSSKSYFTDDLTLVVIDVI